MAEEGRILVVAGPGNNGGDGFVAAEILRRAGRDVRVALLGERDALKGDAARAAADYDGPFETIGPATDLSADLVIDALFGAGLARPLEGEAARVVEALNAGRRRCSRSICRAASTGAPARCRASRSARRAPSRSSA